MELMTAKESEIFSKNYAQALQKYPRMKRLRRDMEIKWEYKAELDRQSWALESRLKSNLNKYKRSAIIIMLSAIQKHIKLAENDIGKAQNTLKNFFEKVR
jgi:hypothetical protein